LAPEHKNGRCRFHGGFDLTGAQPGNRNAVIHGLYSRTLQRCSPKCPNWTHCPLAMPQVAELPPAKAPTCPYEATQYQTALTDTLECAAHLACSNNLDHHTAHTIAMLQVMMNRAATTLSNASLIDATETLTKDQIKETLKPSAALTAFLRLSSEYRRYLGLFTKRLNFTASFYVSKSCAKRQHHDYSLTPEDQAKLQPFPNDYLDTAKYHLSEALRYTDTKTPFTHKQNNTKVDDVTGNYRKAFSLAPELLPQCLTDPKHSPFLNHYPHAQTPY
ncbi:MAG TPA: hypothetical protein PLI09_22335, partial [Candidatus Hydrogenedentes bacterium]|nr:hypothetical protein [Candidatus Hydrogenedentota bacterium]